MICNKLLNKETSHVVIGLGYVGLPVAIYLTTQIKVIGCEINVERIDTMRKYTDPGKEISNEALNKITTKKAGEPCAQGSPRKEINGRYQTLEDRCA